MPMSIMQDCMNSFNFCISLCICWLLKGGKIGGPHGRPIQHCIPCLYLCVYKLVFGNEQNLFVISLIVLPFVLGNGLVVSTPSAVAGSIPALSTCLFHVVPRVPGGEADEKTGPVVLYRQIKQVLIVYI